MERARARLLLRNGVNVVCRPNGSGKSSFLVGICIAYSTLYKLTCAKAYVIIQRIP